MSNTDSQLIIIGGTFVSNIASRKGGAILQQGGTLNITNCKFTRNSAFSFGGVISNIGEGTFTIKNSEFTENFSVTRGSAFHSLSNPDVSGNVIKDCLFSSNVCSDYGTINLIFT